MNRANIFFRERFWRSKKYKPVVIALGIFLLVILLKNIAITFLDPAIWYKKPIIEFSKLVELVALTLLLLTLASKIPYFRVALVWVGIIFLVLLGVEITCLCMYEWQHRPETVEMKKASAEKGNQPGEKNFLQKLFAIDEKKPEKEIAVIPFVEEIPASALGVEVIPDNYDQLKIAGEPTIRKQEPAWHDWQTEDIDMGYVIKPNVRVQLQTWSYGIPNSPVQYTTDSVGRRMTGNELTYPRKNYVLFFGCSVAFGVIVDDRQNISSIFERIDTNYRAYNYGVPGYGTHHLLALFENRNLRAELPEKEGVAFYIYFPGHVSRSIGDMDSYLSWNATSPYYFLDGEEVVRRKDFKSGRVLVSRFYEFIHKTYFCKYFDLHFPGKLRAHHYHFTAKLIEKAYRNYQFQFGNDNFYVVLSPGWDNNIKPFLEALKIKYLDYSNSRLVPYWNENYQFNGDGHPRPLVYKIIAEKLKIDVTGSIDSK